MDQESFSVHTQIDN